MRNHDYPARRAKAVYGRKPKFDGGSVPHTVRIPKEEKKNKLAKALIAEVLKRMEPESG
jgi:hypothetical protein